MTYLRWTSKDHVLFLFKYLWRLGVTCTMCSSMSVRIDDRFAIVKNLAIWYLSACLTHIYEFSHSWCMKTGLGGAPFCLPMYSSIYLWLLMPHSLSYCPVLSITYFSTLLIHLIRGLLTPGTSVSFPNTFLIIQYCILSMFILFPWIMPHHISQSTISLALTPRQQLIYTVKVTIH